MAGHLAGRTVYRFSEWQHHAARKGPVGGRHQWRSGAKAAAAEEGEQDLSPVWSPDGRWVAYLRGRESKTEGGQFDRTAAIEIRPAGGGPARTVGPAARCR